MTRGGGTATVPIHVRVMMAHAVAQRVADLHRLDLLHIKGPAMHPSLAGQGRRGTDADVLVRPGDVGRFLDALAEYGWQVHSRFATGSPFGHSTTLVHPEWGYLDVHRFFPGVGISAPEAFELLWSGRDCITLAGLPCAVPSVQAQAVIAVLNAARSGGRAQAVADVDAAWHEADHGRREQVTTLVGALRAEVAFAAGTGELDHFRRAREYHLWRVTSQGGTRLEEWSARVLAAPTPTAAVRVALRAPLVNTEHLAHRLGHPPTRWEVLVEFFARPVRGIREELRKRRLPSRTAGEGP